MKAMSEDASDSIASAIAHWSQGDCTLGDHWFVHRLDPEGPPTDEESGIDGTSEDLVETEVPGFMVLTQTCDIVRDPEKRPYVEVAPLVEADAGLISQARAGRHLRYAFVPELESQLLVADLDRVMTVKKSLLAGWERIPGTGGEPNHERALRHAIARKRLRVAFPNDFARLAKPLQDRILDKHQKNSPEGEALRALREIRVTASPDWDARNIELLFYFIREREVVISPGGIRWDDRLEQWLELLTPTERYHPINAWVFTLDDMTARDYVESDPLDLDHLSFRG